MNYDPVSQLPALLPGESTLDHRAGAIFLPRDYLVLRNVVVVINLEEFAGISASLRKTVFPFSILIDAIEDIQRSDRQHAG